jgi:hypothetical protein
MRKRHEKRKVEGEKDIERETLWKKKDVIGRAWEKKMWQEEKYNRKKMCKCEREIWREQEKWGDKNWMRKRHNLNYCLDFEFHPTFGWIFFLSDYE